MRTTKPPSQVHPATPRRACVVDQNLSGSKSKMKHLSRKKKTVVAPRFRDILIFAKTDRHVGSHLGFLRPLRDPGHSPSIFFFILVARYYLWNFFPGPLMYTDTPSGTSLEYVLFHYARSFNEGPSRGRAFLKC